MDTTYEVVIHALKGSLPNNDNFKQLIKLTRKIKITKEIRDINKKLIPKFYLSNT